MCQPRIVDPCESKPCQNNGRCTAYKDKSGFNCTCGERFNGTLCENSKSWETQFYKMTEPFKS